MRSANVLNVQLSNQAIFSAYHKSLKIAAIVDYFYLIIRLRDWRYGYAAIMALLNRLQW